MRIFYQDYYTDEGIDANDPIEADLEFALELFYELTDNEDNFFGIINDNNGKSIQFMYVEQDTWLVDIPAIDKKGAWQQHTDYDGCISLIQDFYNEKLITESSYSFESYYTSEDFDSE